MPTTTEMLERHEEILEAIWNAAERGEHALPAIRHECHVPVEEADLETLERVGLIVRSREAVALSREGLARAGRVIRRHRLADVLLSTVLTLKRSHVDAIACQLEHTLLPEVEEAICTLLGHPAVCPDGRPIPPGPCCGQALSSVGTVVVRLSELRPRERARVMYLRPAGHSHLHRLISFGLNPGVVLTVHRVTPAFCVKFDGTELALDAEIADGIFVVRAPPGIGTSAEEPGPRTKGTSAGTLRACARSSAARGG